MKSAKQNDTSCEHISTFALASCGRESCHYQFCVPKPLDMKEPTNGKKGERLSYEADLDLPCILVHLWVTLKRSSLSNSLLSKHPIPQAQECFHLLIVKFLGKLQLLFSFLKETLLPIFRTPAAVCQEPVRRSLNQAE